MTTPLPISFGLEDIGRAPPAIAALCIARISALESVLGIGSAIRYRGIGSANQTVKLPAPAKRKRATSAKAGMTGEQFFDARMIACRAIAADLGAAWHLVEGASHWCRIPSKLRSFVYTSARGSTRIKCRGDARLPAARYWPEGRLPEGVEIAPDMPRDKTPRASVERMQRARGLARLESEYANARQRARYSNRRFHDSRFGYKYASEDRAADIRNAWQLRVEIGQARRDHAMLEAGLDPIVQISTVTRRNPRAEVMSCEMDYHARRVEIRRNRHRRGHDHYSVTESWRTMVKEAWESRRRLRAARALAA